MDFRCKVSYIELTYLTVTDKVTVQSENYKNYRTIRTIEL